MTGRRERGGIKSDFLAKLPFCPSRFLDHNFFVTAPIRVYFVSTNSFRRALRNGVSEIPKFFLDQKVKFSPIKICEGNLVILLKDIFLTFLDISFFF